jgi:hypothetical protein
MFRLVPGYNFNGAAVCNQPMASTNYDASYPAAIYEQGGIYCLAHPTKNHVASTCTTAYETDTKLTVFRSGVNPTADPDQATFKLNELPNNYGQHINSQIDCLGYQRSPKFCTNPDRALATGCISIPSDLAVGTYVFQWSGTERETGEATRCNLRPGCP